MSVGSSCFIVLLTFLFLGDLLSSGSINESRISNVLVLLVSFFCVWFFFVVVVLYFSFPFCELWFPIILCSVIKCLYVYNSCIFLIEWPFYHDIMSFFIPNNIFVPAYILSDIGITTPAFMWLLFAWYVFYHPFIFSVFISFILKCVAGREHIVGSCVFIQSHNRCLLIALASPFKLNVIMPQVGFLCSVSCCDY